MFKNWPNLVLRVALTGILLMIVLWYVGPAAIVDQFSDVDWRPLVGVAVVLAVQFWFFAVRWQVIAETLAGQAVPRVLFAKALGAGFLYGQFLPASVGSDIVRVAAISQRTGLRVALVSVVADRLSSLGILCLLIATLSPFALARIGAAPGMIAAATVIVLAGFAVVIALLKIRPAALLALMSRIRHLEDIGRSLFGPEVVMRVLAFGIATNVAPVLLIYLLAQAVRLDLSIVDCLLVVPPAMLLTALPISLAGWGVREGALVGGFALLGVDAASILSVSVLFGLTGPLIGVAYALTLPFSGGGVQKRPSPER